MCLANFSPQFTVRTSGLTLEQPLHFGGSREKTRVSGTRRKTRVRQAKGDGSRGSLRAPLEMESLIADYVYRPKFKCKMTVNNPSIQYIIQLNFTLKTTTAQVVETSVTVNNSPIWNFHVLLTTFCFPHKILQTFLFSIHEGQFSVLREIENRAYAKFCGEQKLHYEERESRNFRTTFSRTIMLNLLMK